MGGCGRWVGVAGGWVGVAGGGTFRGILPWRVELTNEPTSIHLSPNNTRLTTRPLVE